MIHKVIQVRTLSPSAYVLEIERNGLDFQPGQCVTLGIKGAGINREYSIYSGTKDEHLDFLIKEIPSGLVSEALRKMTAGQEVILHGPYGDFSVPADHQPPRPVVLIGTGTGIAPLHSFVRSNPRLDYTVIHGIRTTEEQYDHKDYDPARLISCVSRENRASCFSGRVTSYLSGCELNPQAAYYLCGNSHMISDATELLAQRGIPSSRIFTEAFF